MPKCDFPKCASEGNFYVEQAATLCPKHRRLASERVMGFMSKNFDRQKDLKYKKRIGGR